MITRLVCNDRNNAMENWRKDDLMNERSSFTGFFPRCLITAQIINSMPLSIDSRCHTLRRRPLPHKDTQPRSIFRLLQLCRSEVDGLSNVPAKLSPERLNLIFQAARFSPVCFHAALLQNHVLLTKLWVETLWGKVGCEWRALWETKISDCLLYTTLPPCGLKVGSVLTSAALKIREKERKHALIKHLPPPSAEFF